MITHVVAIGDVHGQYEKLIALMQAVRIHMARLDLRFGESWNYVFLGDYIDRGPDSMKVVETIRKLEAQGAICLKGNHEEMAVEDGVPDDESSLDSYGGVDEALSPGSLFEQHLCWFSALPLYHETKLHFFVHAGVRLDESLEEQKQAANQSQFTCIREPFLSAHEDFEKYVVHGHTPVRLHTADARSNRCNLDTGEGYGLLLSAAVFDLNQKQPVHKISV